MKKVKKVTKEERELSNQIRTRIDAILHRTHFKHPKIAEILRIEQATYKTNRSKGLLTPFHLNKVVCYFIDYDKAMKTMNKIK